MSRNAEGNEGMTEGISEEGSSRRNFFRNLFRIAGFALVSKYLTNAKPASAETEKSRTIDWEHYAPPPEGVVLERFFKSNNKRTILYLPDVHPTPSRLTQKHNILVARVQRQLYTIVADLAKRGLKILLIKENEPEDESPQKIRKRIDSTIHPISLGRDNPWEEGLHELIAAFRKNPQVPRKELAKRLIKEWMIASAPALIATFPKEIIPIGCMSRDDLDRNKQLWAKMIDWNDKFGWNEKFSNFQCPNTPLVFSEVAANFLKNSKPKKEEVDCYCDVRQQAMWLKAEIVKERYIFAARKEIKKALEYKGAEECIAIISGAAHLHEAVRLLRGQQDVNYFVVAPKAIEALSKSGLVAPLDVNGLNFPDSQDGTCAQWEAAGKK